jgi:NAD(P)-dependent dehydrogenase (short-subunit alcohol dehydrogenase family)
MNLFDLTGKTALVTGASSGLGEQFSKALAKAGAKVVVAARQMEKLQFLAENIQKEGGQALSLHMDVSQKSSVQEATHLLFSQGEKIDILVNNAGIYLPTPVFEPDALNNFETILQTNVLGIWHVTQAVASHMKDQGIAGSIINISSVAGIRPSRVNMTGYGASKAAVIQLTKSLVSELAAYKIRINCIIPGLFRTPLTNNRLNAPDDRKTIEERIPLHFIAEPEDLDGLILYLASNPASRYVTGSCFIIDGGVTSYAKV